VVIILEYRCSAAVPYAAPFARASESGDEGRRRGVHDQAGQEITKDGHGGAAVGALIGALAGSLGGPLGLAIAAAGGAILGESADLVSRRADAEFVEKVSRELTPGKAALVADVAEDGAPSFEELIKSIGGAVVRK
jgi:uncharacterized membrane protein